MVSLAHGRVLARDKSRILDKMTRKGAAHAAKLAKRTLTNLYNERPAWLVYAHASLDRAVAATYGWPADLTKSEILTRLLERNRDR